MFFHRRQERALTAALIPRLKTVGFPARILVKNAVAAYNIPNRIQVKPGSLICGAESDLLSRHCPHPSGFSHPNSPSGCPTATPFHPYAYYILSRSAPLQGVGR